MRSLPAAGLVGFLLISGATTVTVQPCVAESVAKDGDTIAITVSNMH